MRKENKNIFKEISKDIHDLTLDEERALYGLQNAFINRCKFSGPADGESALKESRNISVFNSEFHLRYPLWHMENGLLDNCRMTEDCRAALWYDNNIQIKNCTMAGTKAVRECSEITIENCNIQSAEFGWMSREMIIKDTKLFSEYPFFHSSDLELDNFILNGKYSFQYVENVEIRNSTLNTKDAFWHAKNVTVSDSIIKGEYLGWYSENLTFIRCKIIGTQPLCYAKGLVLDDCEMIDCDLAFEKSDVQAIITGSIKSIKNPDSGYIKAGMIGEIEVNDDSACIIETGERSNTLSACCCSC